ncbi:transposase family protein, partial [Candidatus Saganbacteria bacterium]|nr:transposase family protein [Candidatus Saganbacteria bacterium]
MQDKDFYAQVLGVERPWRIEEVKLDIEKQRIDITVGWPKEGKASCPTCGKLSDVYDHREERLWRHLDTCQMKTFLHCQIPRVNCAD